ncbi:hypothetical protein JXA63_04900 [Candidatus Woesebacteria bacterium]|nr:hypothetical protein [Candidatus Woesebacteria bacterium]
MLIGQYKSKLTDKDRISVPKKIREELGDDLVLARWYENCLILVSKEGWENLLERLTGGKGLITSPVRDIDRFILASGFEVELDSQGRFVLPELLKEHASIEVEAVFLALGDRVEIWSADKWFEQEQNIQLKADEAIEKIEKRKQK